MFITKYRLCGKKFSDDRVPWLMADPDNRDDAIPRAVPPHGQRGKLVNNTNTLSHRPRPARTPSFIWRKKLVTNSMYINLVQMSDSLFMCPFCFVTHLHLFRTTTVFSTLQIDFKILMLMLCQQFYTQWSNPSFNGESTRMVR
jgi:hypothetical protein